MLVHVSQPLQDTQMNEYNTERIRNIPLQVRNGCQMHGSHSKKAAVGCTPNIWLTMQQISAIRRAA